MPLGLKTNIRDGGTVKFYNLFRNTNTVICKQEWKKSKNGSNNYLLEVTCKKGRDKEIKATNSKAKEICEQDFIDLMVRRTRPTGQ